MMLFNDSNCSGHQSIFMNVELFYRIALVIIPITVTVITIIGNAFVIFAVRFNKRLARKRTSILISSLALADLLVGVGVMPLGISQTLNENHWLFGRTLCRIWTSLDVVCCTASIFTLCIISIDRFIGVTRPLGYSYIVTSGRLWSAVLFIWIFSIAVLLSTMQWREPACPNVYLCRVGDQLRYVVHSVIMSFFIPLVIILIVHYKIYQVTRRREMNLFHNCPSSNFAPTPQKKESYQKCSPSRRNTAPTQSPRNLRRSRQLNLFLEDVDEQRRSSSSSASSGQKSFSKPTLRIHYGGHDDVIKQRKFYTKHKKTAKTLALVVGAFVFCWLPFFIAYLINSSCDNECVPAAVMEAFTWLGYSNSAVNPVIYAVSMQSFGNGLEQTFAWISSCFCPCAKSSDRRYSHSINACSESPDPTSTPQKTSTAVLANGETVRLFPATRTSWTKHRRIKTVRSAQI